MGHVRAYTNLPGPLAEGNPLAHKCPKLIALSQVELAQQSHALYHQNSKSLKKQFKLTKNTACQIVK